MCMATGYMMATVTPTRGTTIKMPGIIWIPPIFNPAYGLTVTRSDGKVDTITDLISSLEIENLVTDGIGRFSFEIWNPNSIFTDKWGNMDVVNYYSDYAETATTLRFRGLIEKISYQGYKIRVQGRTDALRVLGKTVTKQYENIECSVILANLFDAYGIEFTQTNINTSTETYTANWYQKPFWECVIELCNASGYECYIDPSLDVHFFKTGSVENTDEGIIHTHNLIRIADFVDDASLIKNRIIVSGAAQDGIKELYTAEDTRSQARYGIREEIINDNNITTYVQAKDLAESKLALFKDPPQTGEIKGILLSTIQPGEKIVLSSPADGLAPGLYAIPRYKHKIAGNEFSTTVSVTKDTNKFSDTIIANIEDIGKLGNATFNPEEMRFSYNFTFDADSGTHTATKITDGNLQIATGDSGNWISPNRNTTNNVTEAYILAIGETLSGATFEVSANDGADWEELANKSKITLSNPGSLLRVRVNLTDTDTKIGSLAVLYKTI